MALVVKRARRGVGKAGLVSKVVSRDVLVRMVLGGVLTLPHCQCESSGQDLLLG